MNGFCSIMAMILVLCLAMTGPARADMLLLGEIGGHSMATTNSIYYSNADRNFSWPQYNWTGSTCFTSNGAWVTMISPSYYLTSSHFAPGGGNEVDFYPTGLASGGYVAYTASSWYLDIGRTRIGKLTTPITDPRIAIYPILKLNSLQDYVGLNLLVEGVQCKVGTNTVSYAGSFWWDYIQYSFDPTGASGNSECYLRTGDSGGPSFAVVNGKLTLVGIHWSNSGDSNNPGPNYVSSDDLVAQYLDTIRSTVSAGGESVSVVPEPTTLGLLALGGLAFLRRKK